jgi:hypothetical protein
MLFSRILCPREKKEENDQARENNEGQKAKA